MPGGGCTRACATGRQVESELAVIEQAAEDTQGESGWGGGSRRAWRLPPERGYAGRRAKPARAAPSHATAPAALPDEQLLDLLRRGDSGAGQALVARHCGPLLRYLQRLAGPAAAEDLHQQTWLSILGHADRFTAGADGGSFRGWLFRIAANKAKDYWRSAGREKKAKDGYGRLRDGNVSPWAGHRADAAEDEQKLLSAIDQLPDGQRQVLLLRYYSDMKFADIAAVLGCPLNTALTRAHKGLLKLREAMAPQPVARESAARAR